MTMDILLLAQFNLMDYSMLFVIEYNPKYAEKFPYLYKRDDSGDLIYPLTPTKEHMRQMTSHKFDFNNKKRKNNISESFLQKIAGQTETSLIGKVNELMNNKENGGHDRRSTLFTNIDHRHSFKSS